MLGFHGCLGLALERGEAGIGKEDDEVEGKIEYGELEGGAVERGERKRETDGEGGRR